MDRDGMPALPWPSGKHTTTFTKYLQNSTKYATLDHQQILRQFRVPALIFFSF